MILYNNTLPKDATFRSNSYNYCIKKVLRLGSFSITYLASVNFMQRDSVR